MATPADHRARLLHALAADLGGYVVRNWQGLVEFGLAEQGGPPQALRQLLWEHQQGIPGRLTSHPPEVAELAARLRAGS